MCAGFAAGLNVQVCRGAEEYLEPSQTSTLEPFWVLFSNMSTKVFCSDLPKCCRKEIEECFSVLLKVSFQRSMLHLNIYSFKVRFTLCIISELSILVRLQLSSPV